MSKMQIEESQAERVAKMSPDERRKMLARVAFPKMTKPREEVLKNLDDDQVLEALTTAVWLGMTSKRKETG